MLDTQRYLRSGGTLEGLLQTYSITAKRHRQHDNLVLLKYNQIASPMGERIVQECRGIILDEADEWAIVSRAFDKFFNHGEGHAAPIDWATARVQEKVDGSLIVVYRYAGDWHVATSGTPDAGGAIWQRGDVPRTWELAPGVTRPMPASFAEYFWQVLDTYHSGMFRRHEPPREFCYFFELCGPLNRIVVSHDQARLHLLGARERYGWAEVPAADAEGLLGGYIPSVREYDLASIDGIMQSFAAMSPLGQEGYVIVDGNFNRIKVKHPGYVALHHAKDGLTLKAFVEIARSGESSEVITAFPELKPELDEAKRRVDAAVKDIEADYARLMHIKEQKAFALEAVKTRCSAALFQVRAGKAACVRDFFAKMQIDRLMDLLGYKGDVDRPVAAAA